MTTQIILIYFLTLTVGSVFGQVVNNDTHSTACKCIEGSFSSSSKHPIATVRQGEHEFAFCGYTSEASKHERDFGFLRLDSSFLLVGFELIDCKNGTSIFEEGEYYTDSVKFTDDGFELFRLTNLPNPSGGKYVSVPVIEFKFTRKESGFTVDTSFALTEVYYQDNYLEHLEKNLTALKTNQSMTMEAKDLELHFLFLKAVSDKKYAADFLNSAPYDGYMGPIFRDYISYLNLK
jgi:hypothetical protein